MLARAARRKLRRDAFRAPTQLSDQLALPWLCPAQMRWTASVGAVSATSSPDARKQKLPATLSPRHETRSLATAADLQPSQQSLGAFHGLVQTWGSRIQSPDLAKLQPWDPSRPLVIYDSLSTPPSTPMRVGIGGDPVELHQNLYACLRVGRLERATAIIKRLTAMYNPGAPEVVDAHNVFLQTMLELAQQTPSEHSMADIEAWYNTHILDQAIEPNAQTFVTLLRASMNFLEGGQRDESIRKYLALAHECGLDVIDDVNASPEFSDEEWDTLIKFQPDTFDEPPPVDEVQGSQVSTPTGRASLIQHGLNLDPTFSIKGVSQKGLGLDSLKKALTMFELGEDVPYPHEMEGSQEDKDRAWAYMRQLRLESDSTMAAIERWKAEDAKLQELGIHGVLQSKSIQALMWNWYSSLLPLLEKEIQRTKDVLSNPSQDNIIDDAHIYGPYLELCPAEKLAALAVSKTISSCASGQRDDLSALKVSVLSISIGRDIESEVNLSLTERRDKFVRQQRNGTRKDLLKNLRKKNKMQGNSWNRSKPVVDNQPDTFSRREFPLHIKTKIGAMVLEMLLQSATITVTAEDPKTGKQLFSTQSAFQHHTGYSQGKKIGWIVPHHEIMTKLRSESVHNIQTVKMPMLVEPKPWTKYDEGGYYTVREHAVRTKGGDSSQRAYAQSASANGDMDKILAGLDVLGKVPWVINNDVFRVQAEAWNAGEGIGGLIPEHNNLTRPPDPPAEASFDDRTRWTKQMKEYNNAKNSLHSQRCFQNFQLEVARAFRNENRIYFPHSVDFRGRAYPIPPLLNHIGADLARSLLKFANGKELGIVGLQWLKIHLANLYGYDKASLRDREQFATGSRREDSSPSRRSL